MRFFALLLVVLGVLYGVAHGEEVSNHYVLAFEVNQIVRHKYPFQYEKGLCQMIFWDYHFLPKVRDWRTCGGVDIIEDNNNSILFKDYKGLHKVYFLISFKSLSLKDREMQNRDIFPLKSRRKLFNR